VATTVNCCANIGARRRHMTCVCGQPCNNSSAGPWPAFTPLIVASPVFNWKAWKSGKNLNVDGVVLMILTLAEWRDAGPYSFVSGTSTCFCMNVLSREWRWPYFGRTGGCRGCCAAVVGQAPI
jgi:hypothetical protein